MQDSFFVWFDFGLYKVLQKIDKRVVAKTCCATLHINVIILPINRFLNHLQNEQMICGPKVERHGGSSSSERLGVARWWEITWHIIVKH